LVTDAKISTAVVRLRIIEVSGKQMTLAVFRQLTVARIYRWAQ